MGETKDEKNLRSTRSSRKTMESDLLSKEKRVYGWRQCLPGTRRRYSVEDSFAVKSSEFAVSKHVGEAVPVVVQS